MHRSFNGLIIYPLMYTMFLKHLNPPRFVKEVKSEEKFAVDIHHKRLRLACSRRNTHNRQQPRRRLGVCNHCRRRWRRWRQQESGMVDLWLIQKHYGAVIGTLKYDGNCDVDDSGRIEMIDLCPSNLTSDTGHDIHRLIFWLHFRFQKFPQIFGSK